MHLKPELYPDPAGGTYITFMESRFLAGFRGKGKPKRKGTEEEKAKEDGKK